MKYILVFLLILASLTGFAQKFTISGHVKDSASGESLIGASVYLKELMKGGTTNTYGFYSITADAGNYTLVGSFIGYKDFRKNIALNKNIVLDIELSSHVITTKEVVITGDRPDENLQNTDMGTFNMPVEKIKSIPVLFGEVDILKTITLTPGVQSGGEGNSAFYVRGGGPDQNLVLLDEAVVYNASHLFGFFSVFNADALQHVELTKSGMPSNYGGRLASVLDVSMKDGNLKKYHVDGGIGLISSRLTVQGPIKKDTSSFIISGRRTYADLVMKPFIKKTSDFKHTGYYFYDLNAKINYKISDKDRIFASAYFGRDLFNMDIKDDDLKMKMYWGNGTVTARWNHLFSQKLFSNASFIFSDYRFEFGTTMDMYDISLLSGINDYNARLDFTYLPASSHVIKFGADYIFHVFTPNNASARSGDVDLIVGDAVKLYSHEAALYLNDEFSIGKKFKFNIGLRGSFFAHVGPFDRFIKDSITDQIVDTIKYGNGEMVKPYWHLEPRASARFILNPKSSLKASFTQNYQYIHLASPTTVSMPTDVWFPSTELVKPQFGTQYSLGYYRNFDDNLIETSVEVYYKEMKNQIEYAEGALIEDNVNNNTDNNFVFGTGTAYGIEFFVNKKFGSTTGWVGYTLARSSRQFDDINNGDVFSAKYDRRHDISVVVTHSLNEKLTLSAVWVYATGNCATMPVSRYIIGGNVVSEYGPRNGFRMPAYHRADVSLTWYPKSKKKTRKIEESWNFSIYNLYNRKNPYFIFFDVEGDILAGSAAITAKQVSIFSILPSVTWNFKF
ncbi:MAG: TonB-dependent receptor [Bacteroidetes bacterium GWF2_43_63]|nr:MAG: TonB-dependent receptor [Bacteroidetes bacterium GWE2_42_42]OFY55381.1 MAG: TonB-dependent receptor [Bacteroidetes bacterium GWF2_43_63]HBG70654.1 TonB-dependent receptor [Bacteroidales bacterium]HCB61752.1 TonB-dependent receptor [Bacteroidales bacterium]HCY22652.1 TonB-dependent receptor [Bacteroidales bacterium]